MNLAFVALMALAYLLGAVPFGLLLGRLRGIDPRAVGSGNIGATNVIRAGGRAMGVATFILDAAKGAAGPLIIMALAPGRRDWAAAAALSAALGHCFPLYLRFRGGKGVATLFGAFLAVSPLAAAAGAAVFATSLMLLRYVALSSQLLAIALTVACAWQDGPAAATTLAALAGTMLVAYTHRSNWSRMRRGVEGRAFAADPGETVDG